MPNKQFIKNSVAVAMFLLGIATLYIAYVNDHRATEEQKRRLATLLESTQAQPEENLTLDTPTKLANCHVQGALPDHGCTPGAVFAEATKETICQEGYTKTVRNVSTNIKKKVYAEYGIKYPQPYGRYEVDHLIPLALGGSNDMANLFPEAASPYPGFKEKDVVENYLHEEFCAGRISLLKAQFQIATDWVKIYENLDPNIIQDFKEKYKSWADWVN